MNNFAEKYTSFMSAIAGVGLFSYGVYLYFNQEIIAKFVESSRFLTKIYEVIGTYGIIGIFIILGVLVFGFSVYYIFND
ncbi:hypothetical protein DLH72_04120 [Candidatus Gracilibacteria bacterium]|nr:MAG: hypothetical protein DLH72_04120 [Candidatus Gracilibacteria bacterium]